jgi:hypothetical protein
LLSWIFIAPFADKRFVARRQQRGLDAKLGQLLAQLLVMKLLR